MLLLDAIVAIIAIGCLTAVASMLIDKLGIGRLRQLEEELRLARDRITLLEQQNGHLEQQVEWQARFLGTLEDGHEATADRSPPPREPARRRPGTSATPRRREQQRPEQVEIGDQLPEGPRPGRLAGSAGAQPDGQPISPLGSRSARSVADQPDP